MLTIRNVKGIINRQVERIVKYGIDGTKSFMHIGHFSVIRLLRYFSGFRIVIVIGTFTAMIGDISGIYGSRDYKNKREIWFNKKIIIKIIERMLLGRKYSVMDNGEWLRYITVSSWNSIGVNKLMKRRMVSNRVRVGNVISVSEMMYPLFQGIDNIFVNNGVELGGMDQLFNFLFSGKVCRSGRYIIIKLIKGCDLGRKMSKNNGNAVKIYCSVKDTFKEFTKCSIDYLRYLIGSVGRIYRYKVKGRYLNIVKINGIEYILSLLIDIYGFKGVTSFLRVCYSENIGVNTSKKMDNILKNRGLFIRSKW